MGHYLVRWAKHQDTQTGEWIEDKLTDMHLFYNSYSEAKNAADYLNKIYKEDTDTYKCEIVVEHSQDYNARMGRY